MNQYTNICYACIWRHGIRRHLTDNHLIASFCEACGLTKVPVYAIQISGLPHVDLLRLLNLLSTLDNASVTNVKPIQVNAP